MEGKALILPVIFLIVFLSIPHVKGDSPAKVQILLYEISPYSYSGENMDYVCVINPSDHAVNLSGYFLTDFEGYLQLHGILKGHQKLYVAQNKSSFFRFFGSYPTWSYGDLKYNGTFSLANKGDEVAIVKENQVVDMVVYGNSDYSGVGWYGKPVNVSQGYVLRRINLEDTNSSVDWSNYHRIGQSDFGEIRENSEVELFTYPDDYRELFRFVKNSKSELDIEFYTFTSMEFANTIEERLRNGVKVRILLEGSPVGGISAKEKEVVEKLYNAGAEIYFMVNGDGKYNRYSFVHSKFIVRDSSSLLISTENPDESSISPCGNRGFGVILRNKELAEYALKVFRDDTKNVQDIEKYTGWFKVSSEISKKIEVRSREFEPVNFSSDVSLILAPDYSLQKFNSFVESQSRMDVEALYIKDYALNEVYPKSGRILVQYPVESYGMKEFQGDKEMVNILHGKLIIGDSAVLVGSMNFCYSSMTKNRELSVVLYSKKAVDYFRKVFERDWDPKPKLLALMKINIGKELEIDMRNSTGDIREYMLYLDGKRIYEGTRGYVKVDAAGGNHIIKGVIVGKDGSVDEVTTIVHVESKASNLDIRIILFSVIFAVFLYKVWKDHG